MTDLDKEAPMKLNAILTSDGTYIEAESIKKARHKTRCHTVKLNG